MIIGWQQNTVFIRTSLETCKTKYSPRRNSQNYADQLGRSAIVAQSTNVMCSIKPAGMHGLRICIRRIFYMAVQSSVGLRNLGVSIVIRIRSLPQW